MSEPQDYDDETWRAIAQRQSLRLEEQADRLAALEREIADADTAMTAIMQGRDRWIARLAEAAERIAALAAAGNALADVIDNANPGMCGHAQTCAIDRQRTREEMEANLHPDCDCGNWAAMRAWEAALEGVADGE